MRSSRIAQAVALLAGLMLAATGTTSAAGGEQAPAGGGLEPGPWSVAASAHGDVDYVGSGVTITWRGQIPAQFEFSISGGGIATGTWRHQGEGRQTVSGEQEGFAIFADGNLQYSGGGTVGGSSTMLALDGSARTLGTVTATTNFGSLEVPIDVVSTLPTLFVRVQATACDEGYGDWAYALEVAFEDAGFLAEFTGFWVGTRESNVSQQQVQDLMEAVNLRDPLPESRSPLMSMSAALLEEYDGLVGSFPDWTAAQVFDMLERTEQVLNSLRNLSDCDRRLFGEDGVEYFVNGLTFIIQNLVGVSADILISEWERINEPGYLEEGQEASFPTDTWQLLVQIAARTGAIGAGATNPAEAAAAERALIEVGEYVLTANLDPEIGGIAVNEDTIKVMSTGAAMGWTYEVDGFPYDARGTYESTMARLSEEGGGG